MSNCNLCTLAEEKKDLLYEDERLVALLHPTPAREGHILIVPKQHFAIMEQVPDFVMSELFIKTNKISTACFEGLGADGTNIIIRNGIAAGQKQNHFSIDVIPRKENDGLNFAWVTKRLSEEEMSTVELKLKEEVQGVGEFEKEKPKPLEIKKPQELSDSEDDYLMKQLKRLP